MRRSLLTWKGPSWLWKLGNDIIAAMFMKTWTKLEEGYVIGQSVNVKVGMNNDFVNRQTFLSSSNIKSLTSAHSFHSCQAFPEDAMSCSEEQQWLDESCGAKVNALLIPQRELMMRE